MAKKNDVQFQHLLWIFVILSLLIGLTLGYVVGSNLSKGVDSAGNTIWFINGDGELEIDPGSAAAKASTKIEPETQEKAP